MATVLLAIGDAALLMACRAHLQAFGHAAVALDRPLAALSMALKLAWSVVLIDSSQLGRETLRTLAGRRDAAPRIGLGFDSEALDFSLPLPLVASDLFAAISDPPAVGVAPTLRLDSQRRVVIANGGEIGLTRTEFRMLEVLFERRPNDVALIEMLEVVWGFTEGRGAGDMVRSHVRNLRAKLGEVGLSDAVRSHRGRGYAFVA